MKMTDQVARAFVISILKMADAASQIYFRLKVWWRRSYKNVHVYLQTKFQRITLQRYYYFRFREGIGRHIEILVPVSILIELSSSTCHFA